jgi:predicted transcriptional regulator
MWGTTLRPSRTPSGALDVEVMVEQLPELVPLAQAAEFLGNTTRTIRRWIRKGALRSLKTSPLPSGRVFIPRGELARLLEDMVRNGGAR